MKGHTMNEGYINITSGDEYVRDIKSEGVQL